MNKNVLEMETNDDGETTVLNGKAIIGGDIEWEQENLKPNSNYLCIMRELPEGFRLATKEDVGKTGKYFGCYSYCTNVIKDNGFFWIIQKEPETKEVKKEPEVKEVKMQDAMEVLKEKFGCKVKITE